MAELKIYRAIGTGYGDDAVTAAAFVRQLDAITDTRITLRINSGGGGVFEALAIYNALRRHRARIIVHIDGIAASSASVIAMAGAEIVIARNARMMVHDAWMTVAGNAAELAAEAERVDSISATIADIYAARAGGTADSWRAVMRSEAWYTAEQAVAAGLADRIEGASAVVAASVTDRVVLAASQFRPAPQTGRRAVQVAAARRRRTRRNPNH